MEKYIKLLTIILIIGFVSENANGEANLKSKLANYQIDFPTSNLTLTFFDNEKKELYLGYTDSILRINIHSLCVQKYLNPRNNLTSSQNISRFQDGIYLFNFNSNKRERNSSTLIRFKIFENEFIPKDTITEIDYQGIFISNFICESKLNEITLFDNVNLIALTIRNGIILESDSIFSFNTNKEIANILNKDSRILRKKMSEKGDLFGVIIYSDCLISVIKNEKKEIIIRVENKKTNISNCTINKIETKLDYLSFDNENIIICSNNKIKILPLISLIK